MSFIDASTASPLGAASKLAPVSESDEPETVAEQEDDELEETPARKIEGNLLRNLVDQIDDINLARHIDQQTLNQIGVAVVQEYELDENSRADWLDQAKEAMQLTLQKNKPKQYPWPGASNIIFPLISKAALQFGTMTYPALIQGRSVVKGTVWGSDRGTPATVDGKSNSQPKTMPGPDGQPQPVWLVAPGEKRQRADRIGEHMSYQLLEEMPEWEPQTDQLLHQIPVIGGAVRKTYRDLAEDQNRSLLVQLQNLVWDYNAASFEAAPRHTEILTIYPHEITTYERTGIEREGEEGMFLHLEYGPGSDADDTPKRLDDDEQTQSGADPDAPHTFLEQHRRWDMDGDGYPEPYVVTVHRRSSKVVRIVARYDKDGIEASKRGTFIHRITAAEHYTLIPFLPNIDGGSYPMGFGHLLKNLNAGIDTTLNQMFDAGHLQNAGGGFIGDSLGAPSGQVNFQVGKYVRVTTKGMAIRDSVFPLPFQGPSAVLFQLLGVLMAAGKDIAGLQDVLSGDAAIANAPPTTVLALIEQGLKLYTAIHKRIYRAFKSEFAKLYRLNRLYLTEESRYRIGDEWRDIHPDDYRLGGGVEPVADPTMVTDMQRLARAQILLMFKDDPLIDQKEIRQRLFEAANIDRIEEVFAQPNPQAAQLAATMAQLEMAMKQAELGRERAAELKDQSQAFLNMSLAKKNLAAPQQAQVEAQLEFMRQRIEALNTTIKAAAIDHKFHDSGLRHTRDMAALTAETPPTASAPTPEPAPSGPFPEVSGQGPAAPVAPMASPLGAAA